MLVLTRKVGQAVQIQLAEDIDPQIPIGQLFAKGAIQCMVTRIDATQVRLGIAADRRFLILRGDLTSRKKTKA